MAKSIFRITFYILISSGLVLFMNLKRLDYNARVCYSNIDKIQVGDDVGEAMKLIADGLVFGRKVIENDFHSYYSDLLL